MTLKDLRWIYVSLGVVEYVQIIDICFLCTNIILCESKSYTSLFELEFNLREVSEFYFKLDNF